MPGAASLPYHHKFCVLRSLIKRDILAYRPHSVTNKKKQFTILLQLITKIPWKCNISVLLYSSPDWQHRPWTWHRRPATSSPIKQHAPAISWYSAHALLLRELPKLVKHWNRLVLQADGDGATVTRAIEHKNTFIYLTFSLFCSV